MKKAIVTGATGFIGSHLVMELVNTGYQVLAIVRPNSSNISRLKDIANVKILEVSLFEFDKIQLEDRYDYFFHLAWEGVSGEKQSDISVQIENTMAALCALELAKRSGCFRFIGGGSLHEIECMREMEKCQKVDNMGNAYKISKLAAHYYCKLKAGALGIDFFWPRVTNTYGIGEVSARLINSTIRKLLQNELPKLTKADQLYDFIYVTDVARAFRLIGEKGLSFQEYIIGGSNVVPLKEYLKELNQIVNPSIKLKFGEYPFKGIYLEKNDLYNSNLAKDTGFEIQVPFREGIKLTLEWIKANNG